MKDLEQCLENLRKAKEIADNLHPVDREKLLARLNEKKKEALSDKLMAEGFGHKDRVQFWSGVLAGIDYAISNVNRIAEEVNE